MEKSLTPERAAKLREAIRRTQPDLLVILENVHDTLNVNAVLRTCDAVGVRQIFVLDSEPGFARESIKLGKKSSGGVFKYVEVRLFHEVEKCLEEARKLTGGTIHAAHLADTYVLSHFSKKPDFVVKAIENQQKQAESAVSKPTDSLFEIDLTRPTTLLFGNEHFGPTAAALAGCDRYFVIPMMGLAQSLNISVSAAVSLYEAYRQRVGAGFYDENVPMPADLQAVLFSKWEKKLLEKDIRRTIRPQ